MNVPDVLTRPEELSSPYVPLDKSWTIRHGFLDLINGRLEDSLRFLEQQDELANDLVDEYNVLKNWGNGQAIPIESGTVASFASFTAAVMGTEVKLIPLGTLVGRPNIALNPAHVNLSQAELRATYNTSQFASAKVLNGDPERLTDAPNKLRLSYEAFAHWHERRRQGLTWQPRYDATIDAQVAAYRARLRNPNDRSFIPRQAEDFCFAYAFGYMTAEEGLEKWPELENHESNRPVEMPRMMDLAENGVQVPTHDHRIIHAIGMAGPAVLDRMVRFKHPEEAKKSWPKFSNLMAETTGTA